MKIELTKEEKEQLNTAKKLANQIMRLACDTILVNMRFFDTAMAALIPEQMVGIGGVSTDGQKLYYDPIWLLKQYEKETAFSIRMYLHVLLHCVFYHSYQYGKLDQKIWDISADLAVENVILDIGLHSTSLERDDSLRECIHILKDEMNGGGKDRLYRESVSWDQNCRVRVQKKKQVPFTAEQIYHFLKKNPKSIRELNAIREVCYVDEHTSWNVNEEVTIGQEQFQRISERVKAELRSFSKNKTVGESLSENLAEATRERYDYREILKRFTCMSENIGINDDEFDYVYYCYGLETYENMPLVEPLEYKEEKRIKEFVIAIDTSASCKGELVQHFLKKTYSILKQSENFFQKINVHIIQCDMDVQSDTKITCQEDFDTFVKEGKLVGFGSTDFRPVFSYVDEQIKKKEFENLKGLIYFTDGYGIYPDQMPNFDTIFVFLNEDDQKPEVPVWAIEVVLKEAEIENLD